MSSFNVQMSYHILVKVVVSFCRLCMRYARSEAKTEAKTREREMWEGPNGGQPWGIDPLEYPPAPYWGIFI
jgi:hypothetical protein